MELTDEIRTMLKEYDGKAPASYLQRHLKISIGAAIELAHEYQKELKRKTLFKFIGEDIQRMAGFLVYYDENNDTFICTLDRSVFNTTAEAMSYTVKKLEEYM